MLVFSSFRLSLDFVVKFLFELEYGQGGLVKNTFFFRPQNFKLPFPLHNLFLKIVNNLIPDIFSFLSLIFHLFLNEVQPKSEHPYFYEIPFS